MNNRSTIVLLGLTFLTNLSAAQLTTGNLQVRIVDSSGTPLPGAILLVSGPDIPGVRGSTSDSLGLISLFSLPPGKVQARISHVAYQPVELREIRILLGKTTNLGDVSLKQGAIDLAELIVAGEGSFANAPAPSTGVSLTSSEFEKLPLERNYRSMATLAPQANTSFLDDEVNVAGATGRENKYFVDGVEVTDPSFSRVGTNLPYNFIKEIGVTTGGYEPEYRGALGGLVNVITYSGSNELHGSVFGFFTNNGLTASRRGGLLDPTQGPFSDYDAGFGIGGPIVRDRLWFYAAYNPTFERRDVDIPGLGRYIDRKLTHSFAGKLTWNASQRLNFVLTSTGDPTLRRAVGDVPSMSGTPSRLENVDPFLSDEAGGGTNISLSGTCVVTNGILVDASLSRITRTQKWEPSTGIGKSNTVLVDIQNSTWSGGSFGNLSFFRSGTTARSSATITSGTHVLKGGIEYRDNSQDVDLDYPIMIYRYSDTLYVLSANGTHGTFHDRIYSAYVQDKWQIIRSLSVNGGLRLDGQRVYAANGNIVHRVSGLLQPRFGFVYQLNDEGTQKVFGSIGRFAQEWSSAVMTIYTTASYFYGLDYHQDPRLGGLPYKTEYSAPGIIPEETTLEAQHYDEVSLGYERAIGSLARVGMTGIYRTLRQSIEGGALEGIGNPGQGILSAYPKPKREYSALVVTVDRRATAGLGFLASYVLSRNYGNYEGLFDSFNRNIVPNVDFTFFYGGNTTGLLPNDRTHVFKLSASYGFDYGLVAGTTFTWETGTPLSEIAGRGAGLSEFLQPRGAAGRTPDIWDLNARLAYSWSLAGEIQSRLTLDVFHIASQRRPVDFVQQHYGVVNSDGTPGGLNPAYGMVTRYQPPMSVRLGIETAF